MSPLLSLCMVLGLAGQPTEPPRLAVIIVPRPVEQRQRELQAAVQAAAYAHSPNWRLVLHRFPSLSADRREAQASLRRQIEESIKAYRYLKLEEAKAGFEAVFRALHAEPGLATDAALMEQMFLYWTRAVLDSGDEIGAQSLLGQILRFNPESVPDPAVMPPKLVALYELAAEERRVRPRGSVLIEAGPSSAALFTDCHLQPAGLVEVRGIIGDELFVAADVSGGRFGSILEFKPGPRRHIVIHSGQPGDENLIRKQMGGLRELRLEALASPDAALDTLSKLLGAQVLLIGEEVPGKALLLQVYWPESGPSDAPRRIELTAAGQPDPSSISTAMPSLSEAVSIGPRTPQAVGTAEAPLAVAPPSAVAPPAEDLPAAAGLLQRNPEGVAAPEAISAVETTAGLESAESKSDKPSLWYNTWWFWTAASALIAGSLTTGLVLGLPPNVQSSGQVVLTVGP